VPRLLFALVALLLLAGCVHRYSVPEPNGEGHWLGQGSQVYLAVPRDGQDSRPRTYRGTGRTTANLITEVLAECGASVTVGPDVANPPQAMAAARAAHAHFVMYVDIEHWSDHWTELSGKVDRIRIRVLITEVLSGIALDARTIEASGRWRSWSSESTDLLLPKLIASWGHGLCVRGD